VIYSSSLVRNLRAVALVCVLCPAATAYAQTVAYLPETITVSIPEVYPSRVTGYDPGVGGSTTPSTTADGHGITALYTQYGLKNAPSTTTLTLSGFSADPGASYVQTLSCATASAGTVTLAGSSAFSRSYSASAQSVSYVWRTPSFNVISSTQTATCTLQHQADAGWIRPKYEVVGLVYAPPGSRSSVTYQNGFQSGTSTSTTNSYSSNYTTKVTISTGGSLFGIAQGTETVTTAVGWGQSTDSTNSLTLANSYTTGLVQSGPASSAVGVDHDYDVVYVWLNPEELMAVGGTVVAPNGEGWDERDSAPSVCGAAGISGMDVAAITLGQLKGTQTIPSDLQCRLNRVWDSALGALTSTDLLAIANADPFYTNPNFNPNTDSSGRYDLPNGQDLIMNYIPAAPGQQPTGHGLHLRLKLHADLLHWDDCDRHS